MSNDGHLDFITGKRYFAHNVAGPGEREPTGLYWCEWRKLPAGRSTPANGGVEWIRHIIAYEERMRGGVQTQFADVDGDGDLDVVSAGKDGLYLADNLSKAIRRSSN